MINNSMYDLKTVVNDTSMNSTIMIKDSDDELINREVISDTSRDVLFEDCRNNKSNDDPVKRLFMDDINGDQVLANLSDVYVDERLPAVPAQSDETDAQPAFKVIFRDENLSRRYRQQIKDFLHNLVQSKSYREKDINESNLILEVWDNKDNSICQDTSTNIGNSVLNDNNIQNTDDDLECNSLFIIDTQPTLKNELDVPTYKKKYGDISQETCTIKTTEEFSPKISCFNCMGNHSLRDCQLPRNQGNINKNRKEFTTRNNSRLGHRYHLSEEQKFSHMIPGQLSQKLRTALGLKDNDLPKHIYKMRMLGYPPGWLEEARLQHSGISLFNSDGIAEGDPCTEEGEVAVDVKKDLYDVKKIYDFPGFNVLPPPGTLDECYKFCSPPMQPIHSKKAMLLFMQGKEADDGYKRKKLKLPAPTNSIEITPSEMEIDVIEESIVENVPVDDFFIPPLPKESTLKPPPPPSYPGPSEMDQVKGDLASQPQELSSFDSVEGNTASSSRTNSPSLSDLEGIKKRLLVELEDSSYSNADCSLKNNTDIKITSDMQFVNMSTPKSNRCSTSRRSLNSTYGSIKSIDLGTPILQSASPYVKLPSSEKFSKNICDVINFENLPDSTGKYEQITGVLHKVRDILAKLNKEL